MFRLIERDVTLTSVNPRAELHDEEPVPAVDLECSCDLPNSALTLFDAALKRCLYARDDDRPDLFDDDDDDGHLTKLRFPQMGTIRWDHALVGADVRFSIGISGQSDIQLDCVDVNKFRLSPQQGGTVTVTFRIQAHPDETQLGRLGMLIGHDLTLTITPPAANERGPENEAQEAA